MLVYTKVRKSLAPWNTHPLDVGPSGLAGREENPPLKWFTCLGGHTRHPQESVNTQLPLLFAIRRVRTRSGYLSERLKRAGKISTGHKQWFIYLGAFLCCRLWRKVSFWSVGMSFLSVGRNVRKVCTHSWKERPGAYFVRILVFGMIYTHYRPYFTDSWLRSLNIDT